MAGSTSGKNRYEVVRAKETVRVICAYSEKEIEEKYGRTNASGWNITSITLIPKKGR